MPDSPVREAERDERVRRDAREIERRHRAEMGKPLSPVMKTAATARELARCAGGDKDE